MTAKHTPQLPLVHGAADIAKALGLPSERAAFYLLSSGKIPGAAKVGGRWMLDIDAFRERFRQRPDPDRRGTD